MKKIASSFVCGLLAVVFVLTPLRAHAFLGAGDIVFDPSNFSVNTISAEAAAAQQAKEGGPTVISLDGIAWAIAKMAVQSMTRSLVNWINSGFEGSPAFVTDLKNTMQQVGDRVANKFVNNLMTNIKLKSPFQADVARIVNARYYRNSGNDAYFASREFTLGQVSSDPAKFLLGHFEYGGFNAMHSAIWNDQNTQMGAVMDAEEILANSITDAANKQLEELNWGDGFLSWKGKCKTDAAHPNGSLTLGTPTPGLPALTVPPVNLGESTMCDREIETPGTVIASQLNLGLSRGGEALIGADEIDEIVGALFSQLLTQVVGGIGLRGVSSPSAGGSGFIDAATDPNQYTTQIAGNAEASVESYRANWALIRAEAEAASAALVSCSDATDEDRAVVAATLTEARAGEAKAAAALAAAQNLRIQIGDIMSPVGRPGVNHGDAETIGRESINLNDFLSSSVMPNATEIAYASAQAKIPEDGTVTLMSKMRAVVTACGS